MTRIRTHIPFSWLALCVLLLTACPPETHEPVTSDPVKTFIVALPTSKNMAVDVPGVPLDALGNLDFAKGLAEVPAEEHNGLRKLVYHAVKDANRGLNLLLSPLREVTEAVEAEIVQDDPVRAVWRYTREGGAVEMVLTLEEVKDGDHTYLSYLLVDRNIDAADSSWQVRIFGTYTPWSTPPDGNGSAWLNLQKGKVLVIWTRDGENREFTIHHHSVQTDKPSAQGIETQEIIETLTFHYTGTELGDGSFEFGPKYLDIYQPIDDTKPNPPMPTPSPNPQPSPSDEEAEEPDADPATTTIDTVPLIAEEKLNVIVRWNVEGAGRIDATARGKNIQDDNFKLVRLEECWEAETWEQSFLYYTLFTKNDASEEVYAKSGDPDACPYAERIEIYLPILGKTPEDPPLPPEVSETEVVEPE